MSKRETIGPTGQPLSPDALRLEALPSRDPTLDELSRFALVAKTGSERQEYVDLACSMYDARRLRTRFLSPSVLGEPVWDMLLALYCFTARGEALSVSGLCHAAGVPPTTALRWVHLLEQKGLVRRSKDRRDARRAILSLSDIGKQMMTDYLAAVHKRIVAEEALLNGAEPPID